MFKTTATYLTPPQYAARLGVPPDKVVAWIRRGELQAMNMAESPNGERPRFRISPQAIEDFERLRAVVPAPKPIRRNRRSPAIKSFI